ncbi:MAG: molybdate ABC transporter permease subunit [Polyangiales bacterium]
MPTPPATTTWARPVAWGLGVLLFGLIVLPVLSLALSSSPADLAAGVHHPLFLPALTLSARTTLLSLVLVVLAGTPLAWWLAVGPTRYTRIVELLIVLPVVIPPAVLGVALLETFGRSGLLGPALTNVGIQVPFTTAAVVLAQVVVSAPFYIESAAIAFRKVDLDLLLVARTLGASPTAAFFRIAVPVAFVGLRGGAALAYARSIGEFGATLLFAGNLSGTTQTMPLAIYMALESDVRVALAISLVLVGIAIVLLLVVRIGPQALSSRTLGQEEDQGGGRRPWTGM